MDTDKLIAFRIFAVSPQFIRDLRQEGLTTRDANTLVTYRIPGVPPELVRELRRAGIDADEEELVAFQIQGVSPKFVEQLEDLGYTNLESDQLVADDLDRTWFGTEPRRRLPSAPDARSR